MAYRLKLGVPLTKELRRIATEELERAATTFSAAAEAGEGRAAAIHSGRKALKRTRALLRLVRPGLDEAIWRAENTRLRDIARALSADRDRDVLAETVTRLFAHDPTLPEKLQAEVRERISRNQPGSATAQPSADMSSVLAGLRSSIKAVGRLKLEPATIEILGEGLAQSMRRTRSDLHAALEAKTDAAFHELRKGVQLHWRHMQLLRRAWPEMMLARETAARRLSQMLGDDHDLSMLHAAIGNEVDGWPSHSRDTVLAAIIRSQNVIRARVEPAAAQLTADGPQGLAKRLSIYWKAAGTLADVRREAETGPSPKRDDTQPADSPAIAVNPRRKPTPPARKRVAKPA